MTRNTLKTLSLAGAAILALGAAACSPDKAPEPQGDNGPGKTVVTQTVTKTSTATATPEYLTGGTTSEYSADEITFMKAACDLYDDGNSALDVLVESFVMPETTPLEHDPERVGELIIMSIPEYCPRHADEIDKFANEWA